MPKAKYNQWDIVRIWRKKRMVSERYYVAMNHVDNIFFKKSGWHYALERPKGDYEYEEVHEDTITNPIEW